MQPSDIDKPTQPDPMRRRLARGGLGGAVVLGSLISRPVLGAVPYQCTISGQTSGNTSSHHDVTPCSTLGSSPATWASGSGWPNPLKAGALPTTPSCNLQNSNNATRFNRFSSGTNQLQIAFKYTGNCNTVNLGVAGLGEPGFINTDPAASMLQLLNTTSTTMLFQLGRATVASLLNAYAQGASYPLTPAQVIAMFNAVYLGGQYVYSPTITLTQAQVLAYFKSLYP